ncbi:UMP-CMP kinase [Mycena amicta]|nr:UMP-CMP kinase [Mycena amicta]
MTSPVFDHTKVTVIFVLGGPGAGKGTQCAYLVDDFGFCHLSAGDLLRAEQHREGSEFGQLIQTCIKEGNIVPMEVCMASMVLFFSTTEEVMLSRLLERGKTSGREDDNTASIKKRFSKVPIKTQHMPVIEHYEKLDRVIEVGVFASVRVAVTGAQYDRDFA